MTEPRVEAGEAQPLFNQWDCFVYERAAEIANYSQRTFDDSDDPMGFTRNALGRVAAAIRRRKE